VVVAIALSLAVDRLIPRSGEALRVHPLLLSIALLLTLIPFYHGALRHLDEQYVIAKVQRARRASVLADFLILFLESCAFLILAVSLERPRTFAWFFFGLLALDVAWALLTRRVLALNSDSLDAQKAWGRTNTAAAVAMVLFIIFGSRAALWYAVFSIAMVRTAIDYLFTWRYYALAR
jgi:hypothetical protein